MSLTQTLLRSPVAAPLLNALTSPHGFDRYLELVDPMWPTHEVRAKVVTVHRETTAGPPVTTLTLEPNAAWRGHQAGQYVQLGVEINGSRKTRCFSVSSAESKRGDLITVTMRANPDGLVSAYLADNARPGMVLHLSQADGAFTLPEPLPSRLLLISGGSGITPVMSHLRTLLRRGYGGRITFLHYAQTPDHQIFAEELAALPPHVDVHLVYPESGGRAFSPAALSRIVEDYTDVDTFACGPAGLIAKIQAAFAGSDKLRVEYFKTPIVPTGNAEGDVFFTQTGTSSANTGATLLEQAEAAGLSPAYGCRMGICFTCVAKKPEGTVRNVLTGEQSSLPDEEIRICVSQPVGDCAIQL